MLSRPFSISSPAASAAAAWRRPYHCLMDEPNSVGGERRRAAARAMSPHRGPGARGGGEEHECSIV